MLFIALAFCPGYLLAHILDVWNFRHRTASFQLAASVSLSLAVGPSITFWLGSLSNWTLVWLLYLAVAAAASITLLRHPPPLNRTIRLSFVVGSAWAAFAAVWLMDWNWTPRLYFPVYAFDYGTRAAMIHSLAAFGLPAQTPFFSPGHPVALHYHYLFLLQCALVHWVAPHLITARLALIAGAIWSGLGLICVTALTMRILMQIRSWIALGLLAVTGLDIIPALLILLGNRLHLLGTLPPSVEWWNEQVDGFFYTALWQPHYVCALVACITGFLVVWGAQLKAKSILAAVCFATAAGSGSFVAAVFAVFLALWATKEIRRSRALLPAGVWAILFSLAYLASIRGPAQNAAGPSLFAWTVRPFSPVRMPPLANLLLLSLNYSLELGFFGFCVWLGYRRKLTRTEGMLMLMAGVSIVICTFIKSTATPNNDLGWRGFLVAQFALLILSASYLERMPASFSLRVLLGLGLLGTGYDLLLTRTFPILSDLNQVPKLKWLARDQQLGLRTRASRDAYTWLQRHSSEKAVISLNPDVDEVDLFAGLYADRRMVAADRTCTTGFGGLAEECRPLYQLARQTFAAQVKPDAACSALKADFLVAKDSDPLFQQPYAWVFANQFVRIYACSRSNSSAK